MCALRDYNARVFWRSIDTSRDLLWQDFPVHSLHILIFSGRREVLIGENRGREGNHILRILFTFFVWEQNWEILRKIIRFFLSASTMFLFHTPIAFQSSIPLFVFEDRFCCEKRSFLCIISPFLPYTFSWRVGVMINFILYFSLVSSWETLLVKLLWFLEERLFMCCFAVSVCLGEEITNDDYVLIFWRLSRKLKRWIVILWLFWFCFILKISSRGRWWGII